MTAGGADWSSQRLETAYDEARAVPEAQNETVADVDGKAISTVRVTAIVLGLLVSAVELAGDVFHPVLLPAGGVLLLVALAVGVLTYAESDLYVGPGRGYVDQLRRDEFEEASWEQDLLATYAEWIEANGLVVRRNGRLLLGAQTLLLGGIASLVAAVAF